MVAEAAPGRPGGARSGARWQSAAAAAGVELGCVGLLHRSNGEEIERDKEGFKEMMSRQALFYQLGLVLPIGPQLRFC